MVRRFAEPKAEPKPPVKPLKCCSITGAGHDYAKRTLAGVLAPERIVGVETGACPHQAVREDPSMNIAALAELAARFPGTDYALVESGGDNLQLTFSPDLVDHWLFVIDVAGGDKIPRKRGAGVDPGGPAGHQQDGPRAICRRGPVGHGA